MESKSSAGLKSFLKDTFSAAAFESRGLRMKEKAADMLTSSAVGGVLIYPLSHEFAAMIVALPVACAGVGLVNRAIGAGMRHASPQA